ncbi:hypothetical protein VNI00_000692 [Paramarasmius palmivorus]|uniref:Cytochrome P450 n=1 Tax=Paramarasmius palmivorus TaxID=297713 RepID=A0AAW0E9S1_9AGAR
MPNLFQGSLLALLVSLAIILVVRRPGKSSLDNIPGPRRLPVVGNLFSLPNREEWVHFAKWGKTFGDVYAVYVFSKPMIMLSSRKAIVDLFEHRSGIYSNRPHLVMANELRACMGWGETVVLMPYGDRFKNYRRLLKIGLNPSATTLYWPLMEQEVAKSLKRLIDNPADFVGNFRRTAGTVALKIAYGFTNETEEFHRLLKDTERALQMFAIAALPGVFLVDTLPLLKHLPSWFPGAGFQAIGMKTRNLIQLTIGDTFSAVKNAVSSGNHAKFGSQSFTATLLNEDDATRSTDEDIKWVAAGLYSGEGQADTTVAAMSNFFLCMMLFPDVQQKAQAEIDAVIGKDRLPSISDRDSLPYVRAVYQETLRWRPVVPMVSHSVTQDDLYRSYFIPKDTALVANIWAALHDENVYPQPDDFRPERYLAPELAPDSSSFAFGFGRRACPGEAVANSLLFVNMACILATFSINKPLDQTGKVIDPTLQWTSGVTSHPHPFKCDIKPRSSITADLVRRTASLVE